MSTFGPFDRMWQRIEVSRSDSDSALFYDLLNAGEMLIKIIAVGLVAAILDERERHRYRVSYRLIRADGLGEWDAAIGEMLTGPASSHLCSALRQERKELTQGRPAGTWQFDSVSSLRECLRTLSIASEPMPDKVDCLKWFSSFVLLRNKTRGHGALPHGAVSEVCPLLEDSIRMLATNLTLFSRPWAYLHRNLSGKYRITEIAGSQEYFASLIKDDPRQNLLSGVYIGAEGLHSVDLLKSDSDITDFYLPNGGYNEKRYLALSYISGNELAVDATPYRLPAGDLPPSETEGLAAFTDQGRTFGNVPILPSSYVSRGDLEAELMDCLLDDRHPVITLSGPGGIGKTWLALQVLHKICSYEHFIAVVWFSSRDIDLLPEGPKLVKPRVLTERDIADEFSRLMEPTNLREKSFRPEAYFVDHLQNQPLKRPILFVFDNFETLRSKGDLYTWLDTHIRLPNKILITTRTRDFRGDYHVEVGGMTEAESLQLFDSVARRLGIRDVIDGKMERRLFEESLGHPYVMRIMLGELAKKTSTGRVDHIIAGKPDILEALFDRTFVNLSPGAKRVFLTLCNWRSPIARLALEAVLLRHEKETIDVEKAVRELELSSFIEVTASKEESEAELLSVPLVASVFGDGKLKVSEWKSTITADTMILRGFGPVQRSHVEKGIAPSIERLFRNVARKIASDPTELGTYRPMLEFICRRYGPAWLLLADLYDEFQLIAESIEAVKHYIEADPPALDQTLAWNRLAIAYQRTQNWPGEIQALIEKCKNPETGIEEISSAANRINQSLTEHFDDFEIEEKTFLIIDMVSIFEAKRGEANATDLSRLAWLHLKLKDKAKALEYARTGLVSEPNNQHCQSLVSKLTRLS